MGKGQDFERLIPKELSDWFTGGKRSDLYWRKRTRHRRDSNKFQLGDIICESSEGQELLQLFSIELKAGYSKNRKGTKAVKNIPWDVLDLLDYTKRKNQKVKHFVLIDFWEQTVRDAELASRIPMLIFKRDYHVPVVAMDVKHIRLFEEYLGLLCPEYAIVVSFGEHTIQLIRKEIFFEWLTPDVVCLLAKKLRNKELNV